MMDQPAVRAAEAFVGCGYPVDSAALLICELDGPEAECDELAGHVRLLAAQRGADVVRVSTSDAERQAFWAGRKAAFPAVGRLASGYLCMDGTIPRARLPHVLSETYRMAGTYGLAVVNVFHAGDGNLHPLILYDVDSPDELERAEALGADILKLCVAVGGVLTGEHGVGVEKRDLMGEMFDPTDLACQQRTCRASDARNLRPRAQAHQPRRGADSRRRGRRGGAADRGYGLGLQTRDRPDGAGGPCTLHRAARSDHRLCS
jgi:glycolate oxidase